MHDLHHSLSTQKDDGKDQLKALSAEATLKYSIKDYDTAAELYSQATQLQAELNGELAPENADLLYFYGRCLYHVAVRNSDVLGSKVAGEKREEGSKNKKSQKRDKQGKSNGPVDHEDIEEKESTDQGEGGAKTKPFFQFNGDDNFDGSDTEDDHDDLNGEEPNEAEEEQEDDFVNAYEILDLARVLLLKRIDEARGNEEKGETTESSQTEKLQERLADTHDLLAEISLEGEKFPNAVTDLKAALELKNNLLPLESSLVAEAHYKLSLALEFSSVTQQKDTSRETEGGVPGTFDEAMREEAAKEMEAAIASCELRIQKEETILKAEAELEAEYKTDEKPKVTRGNIDEVKEIVKDMEQRLIELRQPPISLNDPSSTDPTNDPYPISGILGSILGSSPSAQNARLEEASKTAVDLTNLVKRKKPLTDSDRAEGVTNSTAPSKSNVKRKVEFADEVVDVGSGKKARISDGDGPDRE